MRRFVLHAICPAMLLSVAATGCASSNATGGAGAAKTTGTSWTDSLAASAKKTSNSISSAFTAKPTPPKDAIALDSGIPKLTPDLFVAGAKVYEEKGDIASATSQYEAALKADPNYLPALLGLAHIKDALGQLPDATALYQRAVQTHPRDAGAHNDLGICYARRGMLSESAAELAAAVELQPDKKLYRNNLAKVLVDLNKPAEALAQLQAANGKAVGHYNLGQLLAQKGATQPAVEQFTLALRADPSLVSAQQMLDRTVHATSVAQRPTITEPLPPMSGPVGAPFMDSLDQARAVAPASNSERQMNSPAAPNSTTPGAVPSNAAPSPFRPRPSVTPAGHREDSAAAPPTDAASLPGSVIPQGWLAAPGT